MQKFKRIAHNDKMTPLSPRTIKDKCTSNWTTTVTKMAPHPPHLAKDKYTTNETTPKKNCDWLPTRCNMIAHKANMPWFSTSKQCNNSESKKILDLLYNQSQLWPLANQKTKAETKQNKTKQNNFVHTTEWSVVMCRICAHTGASHFITPPLHRLQKFQPASTGWSIEPMKP
jgi:hypothetical protein